MTHLSDNLTIQTYDPRIHNNRTNDVSLLQPLTNKGKVYEILLTLDNREKRGIFKYRIGVRIRLVF